MNFVLSWRGLNARNLIQGLTAWCWLGSLTAGLPFSFTLSPASFTSDYAGNLNLRITGLTNGRTVVVERFLDLATNGVAPSGESPFQTFQLADGEVPLISGARNPNQPGDEDGSVDGQIRAVIKVPFAAANQIAGQWLVQVSDLANPADSAVQPLAILPPNTSQAIEGTVSADAGPQAFAMVIATKAGITTPAGMTFADTNGNYRLNLPAGDYRLVPYRDGFTSPLNPAPLVTLGTSQTQTQALSLVAADRAIEGTLIDSVTGLGISGVGVHALATNQWAALTRSDTNGNFRLSVTGGVYSLEPARDELALLGYCGLAQLPTIDVSTSSVSGVAVALQKANAGIQGSLKDNLNRVLAGISLLADATNSDASTSAVADPLGNFFLGAVGGEWSLMMPNPDLIARGYLGTRSNVVVEITNGQIQNLVVRVQRVSAHLRGRVVDQYGAGIPAMTLVADSSAGLFNFGSTAADGTFNIGVADGDWNLVTDSAAAGQPDLQNTNLLVSVVDSRDQEDLRLVIQNPHGIPPPAPPVLVPLGFTVEGQFQFQFAAVLGRTYRVDSTFDGLDWSVLARFTATNSPAVYTDESSTNLVRLYRAAAE